MAIFCCLRCCATDAWVSDVFKSQLPVVFLKVVTLPLSFQSVWLSWSPWWGRMTKSTSWKPCWRSRSYRSVRWHFWGSLPKPFDGLGINDMKQKLVMNRITSCFPIKWEVSFLSLSLSYKYLLHPKTWLMIIIISHMSGYWHVTSRFFLFSVWWCLNEHVRIDQCDWFWMKLPVKLRSHIKLNWMRN